MTDIPTRLLYQLGLVHDHVDQPEGLMLSSRMWTSDVQCSQTFLNRLHDASHILYDRLTISDKVQKYIDQQVSVLGVGKDRGVIKLFKSSRKRKDIQTIMTLLYNLSELASYPTTKLTKGFRNNTYQSVPLNNMVPNRDALSSIIYALSVLDDGWLRITAGRFNRETGKGLVTRIQPLTRMLDFLIQHSLIQAQPKKSLQKADLTAPVVRVKPEDKDAKAEHLLRPLSDSESVLPSLNAELAKQKISLRWPDYATYQSYWSYDMHRLRFWPYGKQTLYRQFQHADGRGGRLYGHFVQQVPSNLRPYLWVNRVPVIELDYASYHLSILCALHGRDLPEGDAYTNRFGDRDLFKIVLTKSMGCATRQQTIGAIQKTLKDSNKTDLATAIQLYDAFWSAYPDLCPHKGDSTDAIWPETNLIDSEIALHVLRLLYDAGIYAIPIHDSFIVQHRYRAQLHSAMMRAWSARFPDAGIRITEA